MLAVTLMGFVGPVESAPRGRTIKDKDEDRLRNAGQVIERDLNIPDDIPQSLLDKADCVIVIPSVLKAAFIVGGSYGRGAMTCRSGDDFEGPWGAPDYDGSRRRQLRISARRTGHRLCSARDE